MTKDVPADSVDWDSGGELGRRACLSLPARAPFPDSPPRSPSTPSDGSAETLKVALSEACFYLRGRRKLRILFI